MRPATAPADNCLGLLRVWVLPGSHQSCTGWCFVWQWLHCLLSCCFGFVTLCLLALQPEWWGNCCRRTDAESAPIVAGCCDAETSQTYGWRCIWSVIPNKGRRISSKLAIECMTYQCYVYIEWQVVQLTDQTIARGTEQIYGDTDRHNISNWRIGLYIKCPRCTLPRWERISSQLLVVVSSRLSSVSKTDATVTSSKPLAAGSGLKLSDVHSKTDWNRVFMSQSRSMTFVTAVGALMHCRWN